MTFSTESLVAIGSYVICSSMALVANKVVMTYLQVPGLVFCLQIFVTVAFILSGVALGMIDMKRREILNWGNLKIFTPYMISFVISLYSNGKALSVSNMETVIVFRACAPLFVSVLDYVYLDRELPNMRSTLALLGVVGGAIAYVLVDGEFAMNGILAYKWVTINLCGIVFEMTYGKFLLKGVTFSSPVWGATLYTNMLSVLPMLFVAVSTGEHESAKTIDNSTLAPFVWLLISCVVGVGISWAGWNARNYCSATVYTLLGVVCKFISVVLNIMLWDKHATPFGLLALGLCLVSSSLYRQAPLRSDSFFSPNKLLDVEQASSSTVEGESRGLLSESDDDEGSWGEPEEVV